MNHDIICPHCKKSFSVDESEYASLLNQISKQEIDQEVHERLAALEREKVNAVALAEEKIRRELQKTLSAREAELTQIKTERDAALARAQSEKEAELTKLKAQANQKIAELKVQNSAEISKLQSENSETIAKLKSQLDSSKTERELAVTKAVSIVEKERDELRNRLENKETEQKLQLTSLKERHDAELRSKDEMIAYYKDMKAKMSTKMIGESLEQHCETEFNKLRPTAFQRAYFEKDNAVSKTTGSKGDYIYRENDENGNEIISIMFEMKNEAETTATKHKNEHFFKELDKDRREKNCEYAVLVSLLESDSELYNEGIVDVSFQSCFDKMYVIRPQFFITMITLLRNAALNSLKYKAELALVREQNVDITNFEERIDKWKDSFTINSDRASKNFNKAIKDIEESIKKLESTRDALIQTVKNFETANKKLDDLTIKKLTRGNPTMTAKFAELAATEEPKTSEK